jgi:hypothetical protein
MSALMTCCAVAACVSHRTVEHECYASAYVSIRQHTSPGATCGAERCVKKNGGGMIKNATCGAERCVGGGDEECERLGKGLGA